MTRKRLAFAALLGASALAVGGCGGSDSGDGSAGGMLTGTVGPGFDISMSGTDGPTPGEYTLSVSDKASIHDFHLTGPGVDVMTDVSETGDKTFTVTLQKGEYKFVCDLHAGSMNGSFTVG